MSYEEGLGWSEQAGEEESQRGSLIVNLYRATTEREQIGSGWFSGLPSSVFEN